MKTTLLFAILTAGLNQIGVPQLAEVTYFVAALLALTHGGPAVLQAVASARPRMAVNAVTVPVGTPSVSFPA